MKGSMQNMFGAILGDIIGSPYEFDRNNIKTKNFSLFSRKSQATDDSIMTIAIAKALMTSNLNDEEEIKRNIVINMQTYGRKYPWAGYGAKFHAWLFSRNPKPYNSYGNGSAMRVSSVAWLANSLEEAEKLAQLSAEVTHNHPEGIKGARSVAAAIYLARTGHTKSEIKEYITQKYGYDLTKTCDEIRPTYHHMESCQDTVPQAFAAFFEGKDFEDVIRCGVSLGGDTDTLVAIAGSIAEGYYDIPVELLSRIRNFLPTDLMSITEEFAKLQPKRIHREPKTLVEKLSGKEGK